jgi:anti-anti-sigma factor
MDIRQEGDVWVVTLPAQFTENEVREFRKVVYDLAERGRTTIVADASKMFFFDSAAIGTLVHVLRHLKAVGGNLRLRNLHGEPLEVFKDNELGIMFELDEHGGD